MRTIFEVERPIFRNHCTLDASKHTAHFFIYTPGSCLFYVTQEEEAVLLSGDTLFAQSIGRTDLPGGSGAALERSLQRFRDFPEPLRVLPGHGPETTIGEEKIHNPYWPR